MDEIVIMERSVRSAARCIADIAVSQEEGFWLSDQVGPLVMEVLTIINSPVILTQQQQIVTLQKTRTLLDIILAKPLQPG